MHSKNLLLSAGLLVIAGCSREFVLTSPGIDHPADPLAKAAPVRESSMTLAGAEHVVSPGIENTPTVPGTKEEMHGMDHGKH